MLVSPDIEVDVSSPEGQVVVQLRHLAQRGLVLEVRVRGLAALRAPVTLEELGIPESDPRALRLMPGHRLLIPPTLYRRLRAAEERMRAAVKARSLRLVSELLGGGHYVPMAAYEAARADFEAARADFEAAREEIRSRLPELREEAIRMMGEIASQAWKSPRIRERFRSFGDFRRRLIAVAEERLSARTIERIRAELRVAGLLLLSDLEEERARVEMARARAEAEREIQLRRVMEEEYRLRAAREAAIREARERIAREMEPFWAVRAEIAARLHELARSVLEDLRHRGHLHPAVRKRILRMVEDLRALDVSDDEGLRRLLDMIRERAVRAPAAARGRPSDMSAMEEAAAELRAALEEALEQTAAAREVYLSALPPE